MCWTSEVSVGGLLSRAQCSGGCRKLGPCRWRPLNGLKVGGPNWLLTLQQTYRLLGLGLSSSQSQTLEFSCPSQEAAPPPPSAGSNDNLCHRWGH